MSISYDDADRLLEEFGTDVQLTGAESATAGQPPCTAIVLHNPTGLRVSGTGRRMEEAAYHALSGLKQKLAERAAEENDE